MANKVFNFETEFKLGIPEIDQEHLRLVEMLNDVYALLGEGKRAEAQKYFNDTLSAYVVEHFANEEKFMQAIVFPGLDEHRKIHENFKKSFYELQPAIATSDEAAFRKALSDAFTWIIGHIGKTDRKYAAFFLAK